MPCGYRFATLAFGVSYLILLPLQNHSTISFMKLLFDFFPLLLFFAAFKLYGIYTATAVAMAASLLQVAVFRYRKGRFETMHLVTLAVITFFGGMTLLFRDPDFIKWKPSIVNWIFSLLILSSLFVGKKTALERVLGSQLKLPPRIWRHISLAWGLFFLIAGLLNIYVAFYYAPELDPETRTNIWVNFKVFGLLGLTLAFTIIQMFFIYKHIEDKPEDE